MKIRQTLVKEVRSREKEYMPQLKKLRRKYPMLADHYLLLYMYLKLKDKCKALKFNSPGTAI